MSEQTEYAGFEASEFAENPEPRVPCVLLLDVSGSMSGQPIAELNEGLITLKDTLAADSLASKRAEIAIVTFGGIGQRRSRTSSPPSTSSRRTCTPRAARRWAQAISRAST